MKREPPGPNFSGSGQLSSWLDRMVDALFHLIERFDEKAPGVAVGWLLFVNHINAGNSLMVKIEVTG